MRNAKKALSIVLAIIMVLGVMPFSAFAEGNVCKIGTIGYATLADAIKAVGLNAENVEITLLADTVSEGISVPSGKNFTLNLNKKTLSFKAAGAGSSGTKTAGLQLLKGSNITIKNGNIDIVASNKDLTWTSDSASKGIAILIQNYCNLTLDDVTIDAKNIAHNGGTTPRYAVSNNNDTTTIKNSTITMADGDFAFDCYYDNNQTYSAPTVNVEGSTINGRVEAMGNGSTVNLKSGTTVTGSQMNVGANQKKLPGDKYKGATVNIENGATVNGIIAVLGGSTLNVEGEVNGYIASNGNKENAGSVINIKDGANITGTYDVAVYVPNGALNVTGGTITADTAVYFKSSNLNISGGELVATGAKKGYDYSGNGANATGDALVIDSCNYPNGIDNVSVSGGSFVSENGAAVASFTKDEAVEVKNFITGGKFEGKEEIAAALVNENCELVENADGTKGVKASEVAKIGETKYATVQEAVNAAGNGETIVLLGDVTDAGIVVAANANKNFTLDLGGYTYTINKAVGSNNTETSGMQLNQGNTIVINNGTIKAAPVSEQIVSTSNPKSRNIKMLIQNYADLTLDGVTLEGKNLVGVDGNGNPYDNYVLSTNNGKTVIKDTTINADEGDIAFDVCAFGSYTSNKVEVTGNSTINGDIEVSSYNNLVPELALKGGSLDGKIRMGDDADKVVVEKTADFTAAAPEGYTWDSDNKLAKAVAAIGDTKYASLEEAVKAAKNGDVITLLDDVAVSAPVVFDVQDGNVTLDLGGKTLSAAAETSKGVVVVENGTALTIKNGTIDADDKAFAAVSLTAKGGKTYAENGLAELTVENATLIGKYYGIAGNGTSGGENDRTGTKVTLNSGAVVTATNTDEDGNLGIFNPQGESTVTINAGAKVTGLDSAIEMRSGKLVVNGGELTATATEYAVKPDGSGSTTKGAAIAVAQHTTGNAIEVEINGGTISGLKAVSVADPQGKKSENVEVTLGNATYKGALEYTAEKATVTNSGSALKAPEGYAWDEANDGKLITATDYYIAAETYEKGGVMGHQYKADDENVGRFIIGLTAAQVSSIKGELTIIGGETGNQTTFTVDRAYTYFYDGDQQIRATSVGCDAFIIIDADVTGKDVEGGYYRIYNGSEATASNFMFDTLYVPTAE